MSRNFDPEQIAELARKVEGLNQTCTDAGKELGDGNPGEAFGSLKNASSAGSTMTGFYGKVNAELGAAAKLVSSASEALGNAVRLMQDDEDEGVRTFGGADPDARA